MDDSNFRYDIVEITLLPKSGGIFEVLVDNQLIFSKKEMGRFPEKEEVSSIIRQKFVQ